MEPVQATLSSLPKQCKVVIKRSYRQTEGASSAEILKAGAESTPSASIQEIRVEDMSSASVPSEESNIPSSVPEQSSVPAKLFEIEVCQVICLYSIQFLHLLISFFNPQPSPE